MKRKGAKTLRRRGMENKISHQIIGAAIEVHRALGGPGLLESIYESSFEKEHDIHQAQLLTYLRLTGVKLGLLINFGQECVKDGVHRVVNGL